MADWGLKGAGYRPSAAVVPQDECLLPALTVEECIRYAALLRLPRSVPQHVVHVRACSF